MKIGRALLVAVATLSAGGAARAELTLTSGTDYPQVRLGAVLFADYTYQAEPSGKDAEGRSIHPNSFNVTRAYINVTADLSRIISARITPDLVRDTDQGSSLSGSSVYRLKLAFVQLALDDVLGKGSCVKLGVHGTPYLDLTDPIYRYRFQGNLFLDREGYLAVADAGISARYAFPSDYGDVVAGVFNGEGFNHSETNDQKAFQVRATLRPAPRAPVVRGLRLTAFWDSDHYERNAPRERLVGGLTFEHPFVNAGFEYLAAKDRATPAVPEKDARGWSVWATPRTAIGVEALCRYDWLEPDKSARGRKTRAIFGIAYWFPLQKGIATAVLLDFEKVRYRNFAPAQPTEERYAVHTLVTF